MSAGAGKVAKVEGDNRLRVLGSDGCGENVAVRGLVGHVAQERGRQDFWDLGLCKGASDGVD